MASAITPREGISHQYSLELEGLPDLGEIDVSEGQIRRDERDGRAEHGHPPPHSGYANRRVDATLAARVERIAADETHGSSWLAKEAVAAVVEAAQGGEDPLELARELVRARPDIGAIAGALGRVLVAGRTTEQLVEEANALIGSRERAAATIAVIVAQELDGRILMTHSASATAREALIHGNPGRIVCTVSEPGGEGRSFAEGAVRGGPRDGCRRRRGRRACRRHGRAAAPGRRHGLPRRLPPEQGQDEPAREGGRRRPACR